MYIFIETTEKIKISVVPKFLGAKEYAKQDRYIWEYTVTIENNSNRTVQLISRRWNVINSTGIVQDIQGEGVIGKQPILKPTEAFEYTSQVILPSDNGIMVGHYIMKDLHNNQDFEVKIPTFSLDQGVGSCARMN